MKGKAKHIARLKKLSGPEIAKVANAVVYAGADTIRAHAHHLISRGSVSGKNHAPSAPGEPPNRDTGNLQAHLEATNPKPMIGQVASKAKYAAALEFGANIKHPGGTPYFMRDGKPVFVSNSGHGAFHTLPVTKPHTIEIKARPYMRPARDAKAKEIRKDFADAIDKLVKRSG